jgi:polysaccharide export outer membrane protein
MTSRQFRAPAAFCAILALSACGLPRSGPNKTEIFAGSVLEEGNAFVVTVTDNIAEITDITSSPAFPASFKSASSLGSDTIQAGDVLSLSIWENVDDGLLGSIGPTTLNQVQVDGSGFIFVPYAGRVKAAGNSPEAIRRIITEKLNEQTPDPQVLVTRAAGDGATVSITGKISGQGIYPIERPTRSLIGMIASAGGVSSETELAQVKVIRGSKSGSVWFEDLIAHPSNDIALRNGDRIVVEADTRTYTSLGATGGQTRISFETRSLSALDAVAQAGGLSSSTADPTGVFILREESPSVAKKVLGRTDLSGDQRFVYVMDLTEANGLFMARDFQVRDGDTLYVTEAPYVQWTKALSAITGVATSAESLSSIGN